MLTDSYKVIDEGHISLSGESTGVSGVAKEKIASLTGGDSVVDFVPFDDVAIKLISDRLGKEYVKNDEGFLVSVTDKITVYADTDAAKLYAACLIKDNYINGKITRGLWWSYPCVSHRSLRVFLPPKTDMDYFYKLIDMMAHLGYNGLLLQIGASMEFKRHPELNEAWVRYSESINSKPEDYRSFVRGYYRPKDSIHTCNGGGEIFSQDEMRELAKYCRERFVEIIPEVPSLSHSEYICVAHPELRECDDEPYAATACPSNPELNKLVFDLYDEVIDVFDCKSLHIGHDEWWVMNICDKCKDKDPVDLFVDNVLESYNYLKSKGVKTYMWGDKLHTVTDKEGESHGAARKDVYAVPTQGDKKTVTVMGEEHPVYDIYWFKAPEWVKEQGKHHVIQSLEGCSERLPADIMYCNWYYRCDPGIADNVFYREGKDMIIGNALPVTLNNYKQRFKYGAQGISVSNWLATTEIGMQAWGALLELGYGSVICWNHDRDEFDHEKNLFDTFNGMYTLRNYDVLNGKHLEVKHTVVKPWTKGSKYHPSGHDADSELLTLGNYEVTYSDGRVEKFPVKFSINASYNSVKLERIAHRLNWDYDIDPDLYHTVCTCDISKDEEGVWYTTAFPLNGEVSKCEYVPKQGLEEYVKVKNIDVKNS